MQRVVFTPQVGLVRPQVADAGVTRAEGAEERLGRLNGGRRLRLREELAHAVSVAASRSRPDRRSQRAARGDRYRLVVERGRLLFPDGSSATCSYVFAAADRGTIDLATQFVPVGVHVEGATLELVDGTRRRVSVTFGSRVGQATFVCLPAEFASAPA